MHLRVKQMMHQFSFGLLGAESTLPHTHADTVSITQYFSCPSSVVSRALLGAEWGEQVGSRGQEGTLSDKAIAPFNTFTRPVITFFVCV